VQWTEADGGNGHWYQWMGYNTASTWTEMQANAVAAGGYLMTVTSSNEEAFIRDLFQFQNGTCVDCNSSSVYVGGYQDLSADDFSEPAGGWRWVTGEPWIYEDWYKGEPNNGAGNENVLSLRCPGQWNDGTDAASCAQAWIIEWSADCNGDGIVDYGQILDGSLSDGNGNGVPDCCDDTTCLAPVQWKVEDGGNGHWYQAIVHDEITYQEAQDQAVAVGGQLTSLTSQEESDYVTNFIANKPDLWVYDINGCFCGGPWIGGYREAYGDWFWLDGETWTYTNWHGGNPDGAADSAQALRLWDYCCKRWVDHSMNGETGSVVISSIIEWSADCNDDGIVDYGQILDGSLADENGNGIPDICQQVDMGSCCLAGTCVMTTVTHCFEALGSYAGDGITCEDAGCPAPCPGDIDGDGLVGVIDILIVIDRWGFCP
ncbi:MAG: lectin-like protein, partial [Planctomycetota bacterium]|nr:lectin-like protein [Planctomycetota bacterium]